MGITLGWVALLLAGATGAPPADRNAAPISYTVKMVEAEGVGWHAAVMSHLKPVTRQGAATVWTLPKAASKSLIQVISKDPSGVVVQAPRVMALAGVPATIQMRENRKFVTRVSWDGGEAAPEGTPENLRVGWHSTMVGRKLDQGILVKMVFEDTELRGIHRVNLDRTIQSQNAIPSSAGSGTAEPLEGDCKIAALTAKVFAGSPFEFPGLPGIFREVEVCCRETSEPGTDSTKGCPPLAELDAAGGRKDALELPEIANQEVLGEWLIPNGECLLVSFGPHTLADKNGKAVVRERLAFVEADEQTNVMATSAAPFHYLPAPPRAIAPSAPFGAAAPAAGPVGVYVPYSPDGRPLYGVQPPAVPTAPRAGFNPTPIYPRDGVQSFPPPPVPELPATATSAPAAKLPMPAVPSRSFPEGIHTDGSKAKLPPLPEDEMEDDSAESESAQPLPSPQIKKPRKPKPASDESTTRATFTKPRSSTFFLPSVFVPGSSVGFQFLLPISPLSIKLPFSQRLEIEIFGRVVPDTRNSGSTN